MANSGWRSWLTGSGRGLGGKRDGRRPARRAPFPRPILERLEPRLAPAAVIVTGTAGDNTLLVNAAGPDSGSYSLNGGAAVPFVGATSFTFNGGTGSNTMTVNNLSGGLFAPSGGVFFNGGGNGNTNSLTVQGGAAVTEVFNFAPVSIAYPLQNEMYSLGTNFSLVNGSTTATYTTSEPDGAISRCWSTPVRRRTSFSTSRSSSTSTPFSPWIPCSKAPARASRKSSALTSSRRPSPTPPTP